MRVPMRMRLMRVGRRGLRGVLREWWVLLFLGRLKGCQACATRKEWEDLQPGMKIAFFTVGAASFFDGAADFDDIVLVLVVVGAFGEETGPSSVVVESLGFFASLALGCCSSTSSTTVISGEAARFFVALVAAVRADGMAPVILDSCKIGRNTRIRRMECKKRREIWMKIDATMISSAIGVPSRAAGFNQLLR
jgi:hypothetical protein